MIVVIKKVIGEFRDGDFSGYITDEESLIWCYGGIRSVVAYCFPYRVLLGQPLANLKYDPQPLIKKYDKACCVMVTFDKSHILDIVKDERDILESLL